MGAMRTSATDEVANTNNTIASCFPIDKSINSVKGNESQLVLNKKINATRKISTAFNAQKGRHRAHVPPNKTDDTVQVYALLGSIKQN